MTGPKKKANRVQEEAARVNERRDGAQGELQPLSARQGLGGESVRDQRVRTGGTDFERSVILHRAESQKRHSLTKDSGGGARCRANFAHGAPGNRGQERGIRALESCWWMQNSCVRKGGQGTRRRVSRSYTLQPKHEQMNRSQGSSGVNKRIREKRTEYWVIWRVLETVP